MEINISSFNFTLILEFLIPLHSNALYFAGAGGDGDTGQWAHELCVSIASSSSLNALLPLYILQSDGHGFTSRK